MKWGRTGISKAFVIYYPVVMGKGGGGMYILKKKAFFVKFLETELFLTFQIFRPQLFSEDL